MMQEMEGYEVYEAYLDGHEGEIDRGEPFILEVRELETLQRKVIMARVSREAGAFAEGQPLDIARGETPEQERIY